MLLHICCWCRSHHLLYVKVTLTTRLDMGHKKHFLFVFPFMRLQNAAFIHYHFYHMVWLDHTTWPKWRLGSVHVQNCRCQYATTGIFHQIDWYNFVQICDNGFPPILRTSQSMPSLSSTVIFFYSCSLSNESMQGGHFSGLKGWRTCKPCLIAVAC